MSSSEDDVFENDGDAASMLVLPSEFQRFAFTLAHDSWFCLTCTLTRRFSEDFSDDGTLEVVSVAVGKPADREGRSSNFQNPQKGVKCISCNQVFKTREFMKQHWQDKHNKEVRKQIIAAADQQKVHLEACVEETKKTKLKEDRELLQQQQAKKFRLYDEEEGKTKAALVSRDMSIADDQEKHKLQEQQSRSDYDNAAQELRMRQTRLITITSLECDIQEELQDITRVLQSVPLVRSCRSSANVGALPR
jgi:hypothetical protein